MATIGWYEIDKEIYQVNAQGVFRHSTADTEGRYVEQSSPLKVAFLPDGYQSKKRIDKSSALRKIALAKKSDRS
jgi:hypothetical protein